MAFEPFRARSEPEEDLWSDPRGRAGEAEPGAGEDRLGAGPGGPPDGDGGPERGAAWRDGAWADGMWPDGEDEPGGAEPLSGAVEALSAAEGQAVDRDA